MRWWGGGGYIKEELKVRGCWTREGGGVTRVGKRFSRPREIFLLLIPT
jgi:hypothetical protein